MSETTQTVVVTNDTYLGLVPAPNRWQPNFIAWVTALVEPYVVLTNFCNVALTTAFDIDLAVGVQLDIIGLWVGISRLVELPLTDVFFSWNTTGLGWQQGVWLGPGNESGELLALDDAHYRFLLRFQIARNHWDGRAGTALAAYNQVFVGTPVIVQIQDNQNMSMTVTFLNSASLSAVQLALITGNYINMTPVGVSITNVLA